MPVRMLLGTMNIYFIIVVGALVLGFVVGSVSRFLNLRALDDQLPPEFVDTFDAATYAKSQAYTREASLLEECRNAVEFVAVLVVLFLGGFGWLVGAVESLGYGPLVSGCIFWVAVGAAHEALVIPFRLWRVFVLEEHYDFNRTTFGLFVLDRLKEYALLVVVGAPILVGVLWFFDAFDTYAWLVAWAFTSAVLLTLQYIAPTWILPLFNRFWPLEDGELRRRIEATARDAGFEVDSIHVMDGSRRSGKANAFFTGFGTRKRIVLFDTLLDQLSDDEVVAVLAHELGHAKLGHIRWLTATALAKTALLFGLMDLFTHDPALYAAFGVDTPRIYAGLFFLLVYTPVSVLLAVGSNWLSRRYEYDADAFAKRLLHTGQPLASALKRLSAANLANLTPHPLYVFFHYSHPPVLARIRALRATAAGASS